MGTNQKYARQPNNELSPVSGLAANLCVAVENGPTPNAAWLSQQSCQHNAFAFQEHWTFEQHPLPQ